MLPAEPHPTAARWVHSFWEAFGFDVQVEHLRPDQQEAAAYGTLAAGLVLGSLFLQGFSKLFTREGTDKWPVALNFALLVLSLATSGPAHRQETLAQLGALIRDNLPAIAPIALITQFVVLLFAWLLFGLIMSMRARLLFAPLEYVAGFAGSAVITLAYVYCFYRIFSDGARPLWIAVLVALHLAATYLTMLNYTNPYSVALRKNEANKRSDTPVLDRALRSWASIGEDVSSPGWEWRFSARQYATQVAKLAVTTAVVVVLCLTPYRLGWAHAVPQFSTVARVVLVVSTIAFYGWLFSFREATLELEDVPKGLSSLVDLSTAVTAFTITLVGLRGALFGSGITEPVLLALGPPTMGVIAILLIKVLPHRDKTPRWPWPLYTSLALGALQILLKEPIRKVVLLVLRILPIG